MSTAVRKSCIQQKNVREEKHLQTKRSHRDETCDSLQHMLSASLESSHDRMLGIVSKTSRCSPVVGPEGETVKELHGKTV